ncbi:MAG TPA: spore germination protein GerW family protein [Terriglobales bacterium]|nr:spore germination protein GerW family protein [Terriglobales bacterium]
MEIQKYLESIHTSIAGSTTVKTVFGDPVSAEGKTIIPVARVRYGFGAGFGMGPSRNPEEQRLGQGGGGGGGAMVKPIGVLEISSAGTRFVPIRDHKRLAALALLGFAVGWFLKKR